MSIGSDVKPKLILHYDRIREGKTFGVHRQVLWEEKQNILWGSYNFYYEDDFDVTYHEDKVYKLCKKEYDNVESPELEVNPASPSMGPEFPSDGDCLLFV